MTGSIGKSCAYPACNRGYALTVRVDHRPSCAQLDRLDRMEESRPHIPPVQQHTRDTMRQAFPHSHYSSEPRRSATAYLPTPQGVSMDPGKSLTVETDQTRLGHRRPGIAVSPNNPRNEVSVSNVKSPQRPRLPPITPAAQPSFSPTLFNVDTAQHERQGSTITSPPMNSRLNVSGQVTGHWGQGGGTPSAGTLAASINPNPTPDDQVKVTQNRHMSASRGDSHLDSNGHRPVKTVSPPAPRETNPLPRPEPALPVIRLEQRHNANGVFARDQIIPCAFHVLDENNNKTAVMLIEVRSLRSN
jgi:hypothetical protein